ncbi:uncharacterized protein BKA55DRAFT_168736 [Fusarium redolens]|uniref:Uncharacterized protein n=1 Tax=Fusarium redolens TaxID=48865 RepID=A0A9P9R6L9_FUSRE|nr:uncharacterized protein BKA55DRAFT_168736 [Fusarium redolens]KAH7267205.1 hypothetical protein BKA55DRAFT_168736 [Fusarium redolens]
MTNVMLFITRQEEDEPFQIRALHGSRLNAALSVHTVRSDRDKRSIVRIASINSNPCSRCPVISVSWQS